MHEHQTITGYNDDGKPIVATTGYTVVHRESDWDEASRERAMRLAEYESTLCPCGCGVPADQSLDPFFEPWSVDDFTCYASKALEQVRRAEADQHKDDKRPGWDDGRHWYVVAPDEGEHNVEKAAAASARQLLREQQIADRQAAAAAAQAAREE